MDHREQNSSLPRSLRHGELQLGDVILSGFSLSEGQYSELGYVLSVQQVEYVDERDGIESFRSREIMDCGGTDASIEGESVQNYMVLRERGNNPAIIMRRADLEFLANILKFNLPF